MRWYRALTYKREQTGTDEMHNPVMELVEAGSILVRTAPWAPEKDATEGNRYDLVDRTFLTKARPELLDGIQAIRVRGRLYEVRHVSHEAPVAAISVRRSKDEYPSDPGRR